MRVKLDENLSRHLKLVLEAAGHDVATVAEEGLLGKLDAAVGKAARDEGRMVFTLDVEFADLRKYPPGHHPGIVLFRPRTMGPLEVTRFVAAFIKATDLESVKSCVVVVERERVRVRRPIRAR